MTQKEELMGKIAQYIYPTNQIMDGEITLDEYIKEITDCLVNELESRRLPKELLPLFAKLVILNN